VKYFFDNCISFRYAEALQALGVDAESLRDRFPEDIKDIPLFQQLKGSGVVYISADTSQATRYLEARALKEAGVTSLFFGPFWGKKSFWLQASWLISRWTIIDGFANGVQPGTCAEIKENGKAEVFHL
jgi:hypothetical protein